MAELNLEDRVKRLEAHAREECPDCGRKTRDWKPVFGSFAPEWWATMREHGIDPVNGHKQDCPNKPR